ncbi:MAG TPA: nucleoside phosphorylase [Candidatus Korarchaeota archaeon]|nr:nucleoside phosphorylase [Candidatus Korarchaeota archaeon]
MEQSEPQPILRLRPGDASKYALLPGDPGRVKRIASRLESARRVAENREFITYRGDYKGVDITVVSTGVGCPGASIVVDELNNLGVEVIIRVGTTGGLQPDVRPGDLVIATGAVRGDCASRYYAPLSYPAVADFWVVKALVEAADSLGVAKKHVGVVWTCDSFYMQRRLVDRYVKLRCLSVEMETACILTLSSAYGIRAGSVLAVDGNLITGEKYDPWSPEAQRGIDNAIDTALEALLLLEKWKKEGKIRSVRG